MRDIDSNSVCPPARHVPTKKQQTHRKADGAKRPVSGRNVQVAKRTGAKHPGAKRPGGETSKGRPVTFGTTRLEATHANPLAGKCLKTYQSRARRLKTPCVFLMNLI